VVGDIGAQLPGLVITITSGREHGILEQVHAKQVESLEAGNGQRVGNVNYPIFDICFER
jgi:hypothetical protein